MTPVKLALRRLSLALSDEVTAEIQQQLQLGLIEKAERRRTGLLTLCLLGSLTRSYECV